MPSACVSFSHSKARVSACENIFLCEEESAPALSQLCWQKQLILLSPPSHPTSSVYPTQTHTYIHAHTNTLTEARQCIFSFLINGYIFQAADVAASARSEHGWSSDVLPLNNLKSNWTLTPLRAPREGARGGTAGARMLCNARETEWQCECDEQIRRNEKKQTTQQFHHVCDVCALICVRSSFSLAYVCWKGLILSRRILAGFDLQSSVVLPTLHVCLVLFPSPDLKSKRKSSQEQIRVFKLSLFISVSENEYVIWCVWSTDTSHTITCTCALVFHHITCDTTTVGKMWMSLGERSSDICPPAACRWMEDVDLSAKTCLCPLSGNTKTVKCKLETQDVCFQRKSWTSALQPAWSKPDFKSFKNSLNVQPQIRWTGEPAANMKHNYTSRLATVTEVQQATGTVYEAHHWQMF